MKYLKLLRVNQYIKNFFIFLPLFFDLKLMEISLLVKALGSFAAFCLVASSVYILNDMRDIESDKAHPLKCRRPLASGAVSIRTGQGIFIILVVSGLGVASFLNFNLFLLLSLYFIINIFYSMGLKHIAPLDIFIIALGFLFRLLAGTHYAGITDVYPSHWIIIMTFLLALFLAFAKRRDDVLLKKEGKKTRRAVSGYSLEFINSAMSIMAAVIIVAYILYSVSPAVANHFGSDKLYLTVLFVILGMFRYLQLTFVFNRSGNPTEVVLKDRFLQLTIMGWVAMFLFIAYQF